MKFEWFVARRFLFGTRTKFISIITFISVAGVAVGVAALIVVLSVMNGFDEDLRDKIISGISHIVVDRGSEGIENYKALIDELKQVPGVLAVAPFIKGQVLVRAGYGSASVIIKGIVPEQEERVTDIGKYIIAGDLQKTEDDIPSVLIGRELAQQLGLGLGSIVTLISPSVGGLLPGIMKARVTGIFSMGFYEYDVGLVYMRLEEAQRFFRTGDIVEGLQIKCPDVLAADSVAKGVQEALGENYRVRTWVQLRWNLFAALRLEKTVMGLILVLIVVVAAFNIASTLIMVVMEKTRDIGILKAIGVEEGQVAKIFMLQGVIVGILGTSLGTLIGWVLCKLLDKYQFVKLPSSIYLISTLPVKMNVLDFVIIGVAAISLSFVASLYPARQAARLEVVEALRYE